jgi:crossover junction endodeoxyribonuclease RuvC
MTFFGFDPGVSGGIAVLSPSGGADAWKMPQTPQELAQLIRDNRDRGDRAWAYVERVASSPQMGVVSAFTFGRGYGAIAGVLAALEIPYDLVTPAVWQKAMGCLTRGDKNISKAKAAAIFPALKVTHAIADALLLAEYCRRMRSAQLGIGA